MQFNLYKQNPRQLNTLSPPNSQILALVGIFKNEGHILEEWIQHYIREGVDIFYLIDNGSTDNYIDKIQPYINSGKVVLNIDDTKYQQSLLYNKYYLDVCKQSAWTIVVDLDEFLYSRNGFNTIKEYLNSVNTSICRIMIPWKMYGSNGFINQPEEVIQSFTKRQQYTNNYNINTKTIVRGNALIRLDIHNSYVKNDNTINGNMRINEKILHSSNLHLNHYAIQSIDFFTKIKMTRGDVNYKNSNNVRNFEYFQKYDHNDIVDDELKNKIYK